MNSKYQWDRPGFFAENHPLARMVEDLLDNQSLLHIDDQLALFRLRGRFREFRFDISDTRVAWLEALHQQYCVNPLKQEIAHAAERRAERSLKEEIDRASRKPATRAAQKASAPTKPKQRHS